MNYGVRISEAFAKRVTHGDLTHDGIVNRIHHQQALGIHRTRAGIRADAQRVKRRKRVGAQLNSGTDFADLRGLLKHLHAKALTRYGERRGKATNAATDDDCQTIIFGFIHAASVIPARLSSLGVPISMKFGITSTLRPSFIGRKNMHYRRLGHSGLKVSELSFGSWVTYGSQVDTKSAVECMAAAWDAGVNFFDNAEVYARGMSETIMGEALKQLKWRRAQAIISTKFFWGQRWPK